jgi:hypothetical protein
MATYLAGLELPSGEGTPPAMLAPTLTWVCSETGRIVPGA